MFADAAPHIFTMNKTRLRSLLRKWSISSWRKRESPTTWVGFLNSNWLIKRKQHLSRDSRAVNIMYYHVISPSNHQTPIKSYKLMGKPHYMSTIATSKKIIKDLEFGKIRCYTIVASVSHRLFLHRFWGRHNHNQQVLSPRRARHSLPKLFGLRPPRRCRSGNGHMKLVTIGLIFNGVTNNHYIL